MRFSRQTAAYPCPVLKEDLRECAYLNGKFAFTLDIDTSRSPNTLEIKSELQQPEIESLIKDRAANLALGVHCDKTYYYDLVDLSNKPRHSITLDEQLVFGKVYFFLVVKAKRAISNFSPSGLDAVFNGMRFDVRCGDLLAISNELVFNYGFPPLPVGESIFELVLQQDRDPSEFTVDLGKEKIEVAVGERLNRLLQLNSVHSMGRKKNISSVYLSALVDVLYRITEERQQHEGKPWFEAIRASMESLGYDVMKDNWEPLTVSQQLLHHPYIALFEDDSK
ncbi:hypothetical protein [Allohahella marinimesophila]|uniref:Uncharacterized protein n=1 Tax=Allohahella marinimesophila TaxID=1054972 RepID=A0ABP7Q3Z0_9GAMM